MSVRVKTLVIILSTLACLIIAMFGVSRVIIAGSYERLEAQKVRENVRRAHNSILDGTAVLDSVCRDLAMRSSTLRFMQDNNQEYIHSTLNTQFFSDFKISFALFFDESGRMIFGKGFDVGNAQEEPLNPSLNGPVVNDALQMFIHHDTDAPAGLVMLPESPAVVAGQCIFSPDDGHCAGTLIIGKHLDSNQVKAIADSNFLYHLNVYNFDSELPEPDLKEVAGQLNAGVPIPVKALDDDYVAGYILLQDITGHPGLILKVDEPRSIYKQGLTTMGYFNYAVIGTGLVFGLIIMLMMEKQVLTRLGHLRKQVNRIDLDSNQHSRINIPGRDEFSHLSATINQMLFRLEQSLVTVRHNEKKYRDVLESIEEGYFETDDRCRLQVVNNALCSIIGHSQVELLGSEAGALFDHADVNQVRNLFAEIQGTAKPVRWHACQVVKPGGSRCDIEISVYPVFGEGGEFVAFRGVARDVTDRKKQEERLLMTSKLASIGELASGVAHEINNPLTSITGYAQLLSVSQNVNPEVKADLDKIYRESQRAAKIVHNLLSFARQRKPQKEAHSINDLIRQTLDLRTYEHKLNNITVTMNLNPDIAPVKIDYNQVQQVILNLVVNAEHAVAETGRPGHITITTAGAMPFIRITIADNGCGITPENLGRIFDPFFTTKDVNKGTGLGLSICHGIVTEHNGRLYAESVAGQGASFHLELPAATDFAPPAETPAGSHTTHAAAATDKANILVIDDEPTIREVIRRNLSAMGYRIGTAADGKTGLAEIARDGYDLCLIDLQMPDMSGREVFKTIQNRYPGYVEKVIFVTGDTVSQSTHRYLVNTGRPFLSKPFSYQELMETIENTYQQKENKKGGIK